MVQNKVIPVKEGKRKEHEVTWKDEKKRKHSTKPGEPGADHHDKEADNNAARKLILKREKELEKKEKQLKKQLAYHQQDKADQENSEESICIAPTAPANRTSLVNLIVCGIKGYKKCLIVCAVLQCGMAAILFGALFGVAVEFPMGFGNEFRVKSEFFSHPMLVLTMSSAPVITFVWLIFAIILADKANIFCCHNKGNWFLRGYGCYSAFFLSFSAISIYLTLFFKGSLSPEDLQQSMFRHMHLYDSNKMSRKYWDETQSYFKCCGVDEEGWRNWQNRDQVVEDVIDWIVPSTCCKNKATQGKCQNETSNELVWDGGCFNDLFSLYNTWCSVIIFSLIGNMIFNLFSIIFSIRLYGSIRLAKGDNVDYHVVTYFVDCFTCCKCCKHILPPPPPQA